MITHTMTIGSNTDECKDDEIVILATQIIPDCYGFVRFKIYTVKNGKFVNFELPMNSTDKMNVALALMKLDEDVFEGLKMLEKMASEIVNRSPN